MCEVSWIGVERKEAGSRRKAGWRKKVGGWGEDENILAAHNRIAKHER